MDAEIISSSGGVEIYQAADKAAIDVQIATAKTYPRNITKATDNAVVIVTMDKDTAESCNYALPRAGKVIAGPSVHLARILAQCWGNMRIEAKVIATDSTHVTSEAICFDLESNIAVRIQVKRSILQNAGQPGVKKRMNDDMITVTGNAANAIALRNAIFSVIPKGVVNKVYKSALAVVTGDISDDQKMKAKRKQVMQGFNDIFGVTEAEVLKVIGRNAVEHINQEDLVTLIGLAQSLKDGDTSVDEMFRPENLKTKGKDPAEVQKELEKERIKKWIVDAKTIHGLQQVIDAVNGYDELEKMYAEKEAEIEEYMLCMEEIQADISTIKTPDEATAFIEAVDSYNHVMDSKSDARKIFLEHVKNLGYQYNKNEKKYEPI
jgi:hypothetical protein